MRPILKLLPAFLWMWIVRRHAERGTMSGPVVVENAGNGVGIVFLDCKWRARDAVEALSTENARLTGALEKANANHEHFEREWYLAQDCEEALSAENAEIKAMISDPQAVHLAMLRGAIAKPALRDMLHLYGDDALRTWDEAVEARATIERMERENDGLHRANVRLLGEVGRNREAEGWYSTMRREVEAEHAASRGGAA